ncbi:MAG: radical SAM protein [Candidatus Riflebacteria bacterium]|nr:radical SAM protein [Candidatus Riflebacteria bacterium]
MGLSHHWKIESLAKKLLEGEKREFEPYYAGKLHIALIFLGTYQVGMSNLGFLTVHRIAAQTQDIAVERFFFPLQTNFVHNPPFYSFETRRPLGDFDVLAFSISFEGDFPLIPKILKPLGIPIRSEKRQSKRFPLLLAGGAAVCSNSQALSEIFDILVPGEAEPIFGKMLEVMLSEWTNPANFAELPGIWVPQKKNSPNPSLPPHPVGHDPAYSHYVSKNNVFNGSPLLEIMRGCRRACKFCLARSIYFPPRIVSAITFSRFVEKWEKFGEIGLIAPSLFDHPEIQEILEILVEKKFRIHNSSVKWESLNDKILTCLRQLGVKSVTLAPESGSALLRENMGKPLSEDRFFDTLGKIWLCGFEGVKMYFMAGLPGETDQDLEETVNFIVKSAATVPPSRFLSINFSGFVPKSKTEWSEEEILPAFEIKRRFSLLRSKIAKKCPEVRLKFDSPDEISRQAFFAKTGPELAKIFEGEIEKCISEKVFSDFSESDC